MNYEEAAKAAELLSYRDKLRLAQLLIQLARKEEEDQHPDHRNRMEPGPTDPELLHYVAERLKKLKAGKKESVLNSIGAMFQFQAGYRTRIKSGSFPTWCGQTTSSSRPTEFATRANNLGGAFRQNRYWLASLLTNERAGGAH